MTEHDLVKSLENEYMIIQQHELGFEYDPGEFAHFLESELKNQFRYTKEDLDMVWDDAVEKCELQFEEDRISFVNAFCLGN